ncbi:DNA gyrase subunit A [bacterium]|nr:MAG: DNA gyrase subunit A [bacterium]
MDTNTQTQTNTEKGIIQTSIVDEMKKSYINYAMSVIVARALPDVRDGLKPVQRRILYAMWNLNMMPKTAYKKSARVVGDVIGKYHPHGDTGVYDALVRMVQDFSLRYPLIDGQGNFGSIDGDGAAAMRYTEVRMDGNAVPIISEIDDKTVDFGPNYDGNYEEPLVLPAKLPNLLLNGAEGIAVGMATKIPPHNVSELLAGIIATIKQGKAFTQDSFDENYAKGIKVTSDLEKLSNSRYHKFDSEITIDDLFQVIPGPDFPTSGVIYDAREIKNMYATGRGRVLMRGIAKIEENKGGKFEIIITELPYQVNKARLVGRIAELVREKKIEGISDIRDETNKLGIRVVIELKREAKPKVILNNLFKYTELQKTFNTNLLCLVRNEPKVLNLKQFMELFVEHRQEVEVRKHEFELAKSQERIHILEGLMIALSHLDEVIKIIRNAESAEVAKGQLMQKFELSEIQATAILDMQLRRLAQLERGKIEDEYNKLKARIDEIIELLSKPEKLLRLILVDFEKLATEFQDKRKTKIIKGTLDVMSEDELIPEEKVIVTLSEQGYIKRMKRDTYQVQNRGGKGKVGMEVREEDAVLHILSCSTHDYVMFFTNKGRVFETKVYDIPEFGRTAKGQSIVNVINLEVGERVTSMLTHSNGKFVDEDITQEGEEKVEAKKDYKFLFFATKYGTVKKTSIEEYESIRQNGLIAIKLDKDDELVWVKPTTGTDTLLLVTKLAKSIHFQEKDVNPTGRSSMGVIGIRFAKEGDEVISMDIVRTLENVMLTVTANGFGKITRLDEFKVQNRGGSGIFAHDVDTKTGNLVAARIMDHPDKELLITSELGQMIRIPLKGLRELNRQTKGVHLIRLAAGDKVAAVAVV